MAQHLSDRNLLFGLLALQMDFISRDELIAAMQAWALDKEKTLGQILVAHHALDSETCALIDALVDKHVAVHDHDPARSLASVRTVPDVHEGLKKLDDLDVQVSLASLPVDPHPTREFFPAKAHPAGTRFRRLHLHARGGLGEVFVAYDEELRRQVALKEIQEGHADSPESRARFLLEAEITGSLEHPGVVPVYGLGRYPDGRPFYAMRFIRENRERAAKEEAEEKRQDEAEQKRQDGAPRPTGEGRSPHVPFRVSPAGPRAAGPGGHDAVNRVPFHVVGLADPPPPPVSRQQPSPAPQAIPSPGANPQTRRTSEGPPQARSASEGPTQARSASKGILRVAHQQPTTGQPANGTTGTAPPQRDALEEARSRSLLDITGRPTYLLTLEQAAELAMFNSREYQDRRELLYLTALPVTVERFSFMAQFFAAEQAIRSYTGRGTPSGQTNRWTLNTGVGLSKLLPTGALLLLNFSNQTIFEFINPKKTTSVSTLDFRAIQPLLRGGGRAVTLEPLTLAERNLLYQIRQFVRFQKELYVAVASASGGSISGGTFQPSGVLTSTPIAGFGFASSGLTPGVFPPFSTTLGGPIVSTGTAGALNLSTAITAAPSGYLNTMLQKIQVFIDQENLDVLSVILLRFRGLLEGDVVGPLQVQQVEQQLLRARAQLLNDQAQYLQSINGFKLILGLPMTLNIDTDEAVLRPLIRQFRRARAIIDNEQAAVMAAAALIPLERAPQLRAELRRLFERSALVRGTRFSRTIRARWAAWERLSEADLRGRLDDLRRQGQRLLDLQAERQRAGQTLTPADEARLRAVNAEIDLGNLERALRIYEANYVENGRPKRPAGTAGERQRVTRFQTVISSWQRVLVEPRDEQWARLRTTWPKLPRACVDGVNLVTADLDRAEAASAQHALLNRLDLMNVRAQLVDAWRQIRVFANALLGVFNVEYQLTSNSPLGQAQPLNIGGSGNAHRLILTAQLPLVRIVERNNYRASLIAYQRQRRSLQQAEDLAVQAVRGEIYVLRQLANQYEIQQRQLELAYLTIENSLESLEAPTAPTTGGGRGFADGPAALTQQLLMAQSSLPAAQNALLALWINYLNARLQLYRDLELMPLDARGVWIDEVSDCDCGIEPKEQPSRPEVQAPPPAPAPAEKIVPTPRPLRPSELRERGGAIPR